jgi:predicted thioredoxin/glutaredoxin
MATWVDSIIIDLSADSSIDVSGHALVFNRGALGVDNDDFDEKFSLAKTLTSILDSSGATTNNSNTQLLNSLLDTFNISSEAKISKHNINSKAVLQKRQRREEREERVYLSDMSPTAINNLSLAVDVGFKFSKLPWTLNE